MHRDTKTFSDITDIETVGALSVKFEFKKHGHVIPYICLNDKWHIDGGPGEIPVSLFDPITLRINLLEFDEGTSGLEIVHFSINGLEILPKYQHLANKSTNYIDFYDEWLLIIPAPFYPWYHQISGQGWIA
jgi:hypothetical protein